MSTFASTRAPQFSGLFYPDDRLELLYYLERILRDYAPEDQQRTSAMGCFVPHAGYVYSGECAAKTLAQIEIPDTVVILHTKHVLPGYPLSVSSHDSWETPLAITPTDQSLAEEIVDRGPARFDSESEEREHAAEVVLPFLQMLNSELKVLSIAVGMVEKEALWALGDAIADSILATDRAGEVLLLSSTDMNHYADRRTTERLDDIALEQMELLNPAGLYDAVRENRISMCGMAATACMMHACKRLGADELLVVDHCDSGDTSGDLDSVVGYASGYLC